MQSDEIIPVPMSNKVLHVSVGVAFLTAVIKSLTVNKRQIDDCEVTHIYFKCRDYSFICVIHTCQQDRSSVYNH